MKSRLRLPDTFPVTCHTDHVGLGSTFVAINGYNEDGTNYIPLALQKGAKTVVVQYGTKLLPEIQQIIEEKNACVEYVENTRTALAQLSAQAAGFPVDTLKIIGITGTKGKTTSVFLMEHILKEAGYKTARISSVSNAILNVSEPSVLTTPPADYLQMFLAQCVKKGVEWVVMEVAAHALVLDRIAEITFDGVIFTNFEPEHLDFFKDIDDYFNAKLRIFDHIKKNYPVFVNADNSWCKQIAQHHPFVKQFGLDNPELDITALVDIGWEHRLTFTLPWQGRKNRLICPSLIGRFNASNIIGAVGVALEYGIAIEDIAIALHTFEGVPGRQDRHQLPNGATCIIDHAHTPGSYNELLSLLRLLTNNLIVVFGLGGQRDKSKRPKMGAIAAQYADLVIITSDNPRNEDPQKIIEEIYLGIPKDKKNKVLCEVNRKKAIEKAYKLSSKNSILAILGKGREESQIIGEKIFPFSDHEIIKSL